jgi:hypothetical protein
MSYTKDELVLCGKGGRISGGCSAVNAADDVL